MKPFFLKKKKKKKKKTVFDFQSSISQRNPKESLKALEQTPYSSFPSLYIGKILKNHKK
jgi:hypothetical protein